MRDAAIGAFVFVLAMARSLADGVGFADESWFLQVIARLQAGDVLYRDVAFGATPLSVYLTSAIATVTGVEIVAVKLATNLSFALMAVVAIRLGERAGLARSAGWALVAAMVIWGRPHGNPPYTVLAMLGFAVAVALAFDRRGDGRARDGRWLAAGLAAGASFAAKQNVGVLAAIAVAAAALAVEAPAGRLGRRMLLVSAGFAAFVVIALMPVWLSGAGWSLWDYGFAAKGAYVEQGGSSLVTALREWIGSVAHVFGSGDPGGALHGIVVLLPIATAVAVLVTWRQLDRRRRALAIVAAIATLTAFPRWDRFHMVYAVPFHVLAIAAAVSAGRGVRPAGASSRGRWLAVAAAMLAAVVVLRPAAVAVAAGHRLTSLEHFRGTLWPPDREAAVSASAARLRLASEALAKEAGAGSAPIFILSAEAGFWYLAADIRNPTPFDIPATTSVGRGGVPWLLSELAAGRLDRVCLDESASGRLALEVVARFVRDRFVRGADIGPCRLYRARPTLA